MFQNKCQISIIIMIYNFRTKYNEISNFPRNLSVYFNQFFFTLICVSLFTIYLIRVIMIFCPKDLRTGNLSFVIWFSLEMKSGPLKPNMESKLYLASKLNFIMNFLSITYLMVLMPLEYVIFHYTHKTFTERLL